MAQEASKEGQSSVRLRLQRVESEHRLSRSDAGRIPGRAAYRPASRSGGNILHEAARVAQLAATSAATRVPIAQA